MMIINVRLHCIKPCKQCVLEFLESIEMNFESVPVFFKSVRDRTKIFKCKFVEYFLPGYEFYIELHISPYV